MKKIITIMVLAIASINCQAEEKKKTIQVSATIKPYCKLVVEKEEIKHLCPGYKTEEVITSRTTKDEKTNTVTIEY